VAYPSIVCRIKRVLFSHFVPDACVSIFQSESSPKILLWEAFFVADTFFAALTEIRQTGGLLETVVMGISPVAPVG
jgi:hypothetical protein